MSKFCSCKPYGYSLRLIDKVIERAPSIQSTPITTMTNLELYMDALRAFIIGILLAAICTSCVSMQPKYRSKKQDKGKIKIYENPYYETKLAPMGAGLVVLTTVGGYLFMKENPLELKETNSALGAVGGFLIGALAIKLMGNGQKTIVTKENYKQWVDDLDEGLEAIHFTPKINERGYHQTSFIAAAKPGLERSYTAKSVSDLKRYQELFPNSPYFQTIKAKYLASVKTLFECLDLYRSYPGSDVASKACALVKYPGQQELYVKYIPYGDCAERFAQEIYERRERENDEMWDGLIRTFVPPLVTIAAYGLLQESHPKIARSFLICGLLDAISRHVDDESDAITLVQVLALLVKQPIPSDAVDQERIIKEELYNAGFTEFSATDSLIPIISCVWALN